MAKPDYYRPDVDGLRCIAVLFVLLFHVYPNFFPGGYIGVDIFFVISGFVITIGIKSSVKKQTFSYKNFILRRAKRIFPLLFAVIVATIPFSWYHMLPSEFGDFSASAISSLFFVSNFFFAATDPYLIESIKDNPLIHTWSLGVEVQFYLIFPFLVVFALQRNSALAIQIVLLMCFLSFVFAILFTFWAKDISFYLPFSRFWEFGLGALIALKDKNRKKNSNYKLSEVSSWTSLAILFVCLFYFDDKVAHPSVLTFFPVISVASLIWFGEISKITKRILSSKPFVFIGLISYSIYLLHQPIFTFLRIYSNAGQSFQTTFIGFCLVFILSVISWSFIEKPFRNNYEIKFLSNSLITSPFYLLLILLSIFTYFETSRIKFFSSNFMYEPVRGTMKSDGTKCNVNQVNKQCIIGDLNQTPTMSLLGDSQARALVYSFDKILKEKRLAANVYIMNGCPFIKGVRRVSYQRDCNNYVNETISKLSKQNNENIILLDSRNLYISGKNAASKKSNKNLLVYPVDWGDWQKEGRVKEVAKLQRQTVIELLNLNARLTFIFPVPDAPKNVPKEVQKRVEKASLPYNYPLKSYLERSQSIFELADEFKVKTNFRVIYPHKVFCDSGECVTHSDAKIFYTDSNHLSIDGANFLLNNIISEILVK